MSIHKPKARFICTKPEGLGTGTTVWLQKHGVSVRPSLSSKKIQEITAVEGLNSIGKPSVARLSFTHPCRVFKQTMPILDQFSW